MRALFLAFALGLLLTACGNRGGESTEATAPQGKPQVAAVNYPLAYFAERIGGDTIDVVFPAPAEDDPAFWEPDDAVVALFQGADLILLNGAIYAKWLAKASLPASKTVDTTRRIKDRYLQMKGVITHSHGPEGKHTHKGTAFTTWLDPEIALVQATVVKDALVKLVPDDADAMTSRYTELEKDLQELDARLKKAVAVHPDREVIFSHPVYQYLQKALAIHGRSVHWEAGDIPTEAGWKRFDELLQATPVHWMIWESQPREETVAALKERGVEAVVYDPAGNRPASGDFMDMMRSNAAALEQAFR